MEGFFKDQKQTESRSLGRLSRSEVGFCPEIPRHSNFSGEAAPPTVKERQSTTQSALQGKLALGWGKSLLKLCTESWISHRFAVWIQATSVARKASGEKKIKVLLVGSVPRWLAEVNANPPWKVIVNPDLKEFSKIKLQRKRAAHRDNRRQRGGRYNRRHNQACRDGRLWNYRTWNHAISQQLLQYVRETEKEMCNLNKNRRPENHQADLKNNEPELLEIIKKELKGKKIQWLS